MYFIKKGTGKISAMATVVSVQNYIKLIDDGIGKVLEDNQSKLNLSNKQKDRWEDRLNYMLKR